MIIRILVFWGLYWALIIYIHIDAYSRQNQFASCPPCYLGKARSTQQKPQSKQLHTQGSMDLGGLKFRVFDFDVQD